MLSLEFREFYDNWRRKAEDYPADGGIQSAFDRFFTLWVTYNRLYGEATFRLADTGAIQSPKCAFPDTRAAKDYVRQFVGSANLIQRLEANADCLEALRAVQTLLDGPVNGRQFSIKLRMVDGEPQRPADLELLRRFRSDNRNERAGAVLDFLYSVRCNLFHGHKSFEPVQVEVMRPANVLLRQMIDILFEYLDRP